MFKIISLILLTFIFNSFFSPALCFASKYISKDVKKIKNIAILPFENLSGDFKAYSIIMPLLKEKLKEKGFNLVPEKNIRNFLASRRIRKMGVVDRARSFELRRELNADAVLMTYIDQFSSIHEEVSVGLTLRLVGTWNCSVIWTDEASYTGSDFIGFLGIGKIKNIEKLSKIVVDNITKHIPIDYIISSKGRKFEIGNVRINPPITTGGENIDIKARIFYMDEEPKSVKAIINGTEYSLLKDENNYYAGKILTPSTGGIYTMNILVSNKSDSVIFNSIGTIMVDTLAPKVSISSSTGALRGVGSQSSVIFKLTSNESVVKWEVRIIDDANKTVRSGKAYGVLPNALIWNGESDKGGRVMDGLYRMVVTVWDEAGNYSRAQKELRLDATPPEVRISLSLTEENKLLVDLTYDKREIFDKWNLMIFNDNSELLKKIEGEGTIDREIIISLDNYEEKDEARKIVYSFEAVDIAGNSFKMSDHKYLISSVKWKKFAEKNENNNSQTEDDWDSMADF